MKQDPTLLTGILVKLQSVKVEGAHRNLFNWGTAQPVNVGNGTLVAKDTRPVPNPLAGRMIGPEEPPKPVPPPPPPPPPAIPLKFYGYVTNASNKGPRRAFFLEGDDIHVVNEGDTVKRRYRIVRIGVNSVVVEDTDFHSQQTLPLEEAPG